MVKGQNARFGEIDSSGMLETILRFPDQVREAWRESRGFEVTPPCGSGHLIFSGMGGSAIGADLVKDLLGKEAGVPFHIERGYSLPDYVGTGSTVVCVSYSGNTEEVLSLFDEARSRGCSLGVITSGGRLYEESKDSGCGIMKIRPGLPPRAALGLLFISILRLVSNWGWIRFTDSRLEQFAGNMEHAIRLLGPSREGDENPAEELCRRIGDRIPIIYSGDGLLRAVSYRWKCQFNENSKSMAFSGIFPETGHNEVMGLESLESVRDKLFLIFLMDRGDHSRVRRRMEVTYSMLKERAGGAAAIDSGLGQEGLAEAPERLLSTVALGDFTSVYLAFQREIDPTPIDMIEEIKRILRMEEQ